MLQLCEGWGYRPGWAKPLPRRARGAGPLSKERSRGFRARPGEPMTQRGAEGLTLLIPAFAIGIVTGWPGQQARCATAHRARPLARSA